MTDGVIDKCNVKTATCVIHYDSAPTKKLFGKRMYCMASSYPSTKVSTMFYSQHSVHVTVLLLSGTSTL